MFLKIKENIIRFFVITFWLIIFIATGLGVARMLIYLPINLSSSERTSTGLVISFALLIALGFKYEKMNSEIYKWKNKDKIINKFNEHIFKNDDER